MPKPTILLHKIRVPVFKATLWVVIGATVKEGIDYVEDKISERIALEKDKKTIRAYTYAYETENGKKRYMLFFKYTAKPGEIAHEVKHMVNILFNWHGYRLSTSNDEMECYYLDELVDKVHYTISRYKKLHKKIKQKQLKPSEDNAILSTKTVTLT